MKQFNYYSGNGSGSIRVRGIQIGASAFTALANEKGTPCDDLEDMQEVFERARVMV